MKAILEFNLPEEKQEFLTASKALDLLSACCHIDEYARRALKHGGVDLETTLSYIRGVISDAMEGLD